MAQSAYLQQIQQKYQPRDLSRHAYEIVGLKSFVQAWAHTCFIEIIDSGSRAKGTAISLASDVDYLISLTSSCNESSGGLKSIFDSLWVELGGKYRNARKQNVSVRINLNGLEIDVTPARKLSGNTNDHWLYVSKSDTRKQTNIQKHIKDVSQSGRTAEIKLLKIWRELNKLDFPSVYLEYLLINNILLNKSAGNANLEDNVWFALGQLANDTNNPLFSKISNPANSNNILSDLLTTEAKRKIISSAKIARSQSNWSQIVW